MSIKVGILFSNYGPYHVARIEGIVNSYQRNFMDIVAIELSRSEEQYPWKIELRNYNFPLVSVIKEQSLEKVNNVKLLSNLNKILNDVNPDVLAISGYFEIAMLFALIWCILHGKKAILFSETTEKDFTRYWWRELLKKWIIKQYKAALVGGKPHQRYMMKLGMPKAAIFDGYDVVGNENFHPNKIKNLPCPIPKPYFLAINRFVNKKNLPFLISAYADYLQIMGSLGWDLVICGDGKLRPQIEKQIAKLGLKNHVHLPGFLQQQELLPYFAHANCFIHASIQEQWGLVVNEAMASGLPVLVSNRCGCFEDLVIEGVNGFGFDPKNRQELTELMAKMSSREIDLDQIGQASFKQIQKYSTEYFAENFKQAVEYAINCS